MQQGAEVRVNSVSS